MVTITPVRAVSRQNSLHASSQRMCDSRSSHYSSESAAGGRLPEGARETGAQDTQNVLRAPMSLSFPSFYCLQGQNPADSCARDPTDLT